jgi:nucleoside-diphosphate-sugar epimerase
VSRAKALITGGGGFVAARLAERLVHSGVETELLIRPGSDAWRLDRLRADAEIHELDLRDAEAARRALREARADWIFHLAAHGAYSWQTEAQAIIDTNFTGALNLLQAAGEQGFSALVQAGSSSEYGFKDHAPGEDEAPEPNSYYAVAKAAATLLGQHLANQQGLNVTTLRLSSVYGPWEDPRRLVPTLIAKGMGGTLPSLVAPDTARDFVYVDDACDAFVAVAAAGRPASRIYNVGSGTQTTIRELVELARAQLGIEVTPEWGSHEARAWDASVWVSDPRRIARELGWRPEHELAAGFAATVAWLRERDDLWSRYGLDRPPAQTDAFSGEPGAADR